MTYLIKLGLWWLFWGLITLFITEGDSIIGMIIYGVGALLIIIGELDK